MQLKAWKNQFGIRIFIPPMTETKLIRINESSINLKEIEEVVTCLENGGIIIYPTDTVYGMGCDIRNTRAVERIARIKGIKPEDAKFAMIFHDLSHLSAYCKPITNTTFRVMKRLLPGPFTFIMEANNNVPKIFNKTKKKEVGIRVPDHAVPREIVRVLASPIVTTSVVDDDEILGYTTDPSEIFGNFNGVVDLIIDGGFGNNIPSTILDATGDTISLIREGLGDASSIL